MINVEAHCRMAREIITKKSLFLGTEWYLVCVSPAHTAHSSRQEGTTRVVLAHQREFPPRPNKRTLFFSRGGLDESWISAGWDEVRWGG